MRGEREERRGEREGVRFIHVHRPDP